MLMPKRLSRLDLNQLAKSIVDQATSDEISENKKLTGKRASGQKGGLKGGNTRMSTLKPEQRSELARKAALTRWGNGAPKNFGAPKPGSTK